MKLLFTGKVIHGEVYFHNDWQPVAYRILNLTGIFIIPFSADGVASGITGDYLFNINRSIRITPRKVGDDWGSKEWSILAFLTTRRLI